MTLRIPWHLCGLFPSALARSSHLDQNQASPTMTCPDPPSSPSVCETASHGRTPTQLILDLFAASAPDPLAFDPWASRM